MSNGIDTTFMVQFEVREHPGHETARAFFERRVRGNETFALAPQCLAEFIHVITDSRRFEHPLSVSEAVARAETWWNAQEIRQVFPNNSTAPLFFGWMTAHKLGRKRLLDTLLAATYLSNGVSSIATSNVADFAILDGIDAVDPSTV